MKLWSFDCCLEGFSCDRPRIHQSFFSVIALSFLFLVFQHHLTIFCVIFLIGAAIQGGLYTSSCGGIAIRDPSGRMKNIYIYHCSYNPNSCSFMLLYSHVFWCWSSFIWSPHLIDI